MGRINRARVLTNLREAREQLEEIERRLESNEALPEAELQILLEHAYHHLNWAWNTRSITKSAYANFTDAFFNAWSRTPKDLEPLRVNTRRLKPRDV